MNKFLATLSIIGCIMIVGYVEDPCTTEGLPKSCIEINN